MVMVLNVEVEFLLKHFDFQYLESIYKKKKKQIDFNFQNKILTIGGDNFDRLFSIVCRSLSNSAAATTSTGSVVG